MAIYRWKPGSHMKVEPRIAGGVCKYLEQNGGLTPANLVEASRDESAPLHGCFEWDDRKAAEHYRETQAGYIIRSLEVVVEQAEPVRAFVSLSVSTEKKEQHAYVSTIAAVSEPDMREQVLRNAKAELAAFARKYRNMEELAGVIAEIEKVV